MKQTTLTSFKRKRDGAEDDKQEAGPSQPPQGRAKRLTEHKVGWTELGNGSRLGYWPKHIPARRAELTLKELLNDVPWEQRNVQIHGKTLPQPRLVAYYAEDTSKTYMYSGLTLKPLAFTPLLAELKQMAEELSGDTFNSVLCNLYRDGSDSVAWHADNEKHYAPTCSIASISLGTPRDFLMRSNADPTRQLQFSLGAGDVLVMAGSTQLHWQHAVPKRAPAGKYGPRINLTFRQLLFQPGKK